jgi:hypothetical protein
MNQNTNWNLVPTGNNFKLAEGYYEELNINPELTQARATEDSIPVQMVQPGYLPMTRSMPNSDVSQSAEGKFI